MKQNGGFWIPAIFFLLAGASAANAQKWYAGHFTDIKGNVESGFIRINPSGNGPVKDEGFIEFKEDNKANPFKLSASELKSFVIGRDSFVVAHAPGSESWGKNEFDFVRVMLDEDVKLYVAGAAGGGKRNTGFVIEPGISTGFGSGNFGAGIGGSVPIPIGGGGASYQRTAWYYGENTASMKRITDQNFEDVMINIMGDYPEIVDKIRAKVYLLENIDRLLAYYKQVEKANP